MAAIFGAMSRRQSTQQLCSVTWHSFNLPGGSYVQKGVLNNVPINDKVSQLKDKLKIDAKLPKGTLFNLIHEGKILKDNKPISFYGAAAGGYFSSVELKISEGIKLSLKTSNGNMAHSG